MKKFICLHGHFYQPPRENPWTGEVDLEESASPFHDWNERISKECYEANTQAPILDASGNETARLNNFSKINFDMGPTLLSWMRRKAPEVYRRIVEADRESVSENNGHGNAIAQVYNHLIMPLANRRDKITQVVWGIRDFEFHFKRKPEGMWLSETAVDRETLNVLADQGVLYTILAPHQAKRIRHVGFGARWAAVHHEGINPKHPYRILLEKGKQFHLFFYDAPLSRGIAFEGLLNSGDELARRLLGAFGSRDREQLVSTATDGESFGHHHKFGDMALAYALRKIESENLATMTNYGEFLDRFGSYWEADIHENSSWSCAHGIERWRSDCGCRLNHQGGWNQKWRSVLRQAFDDLKQAVDRVFEVQTGSCVRDPWQMRNEYIEVMLDPSESTRKAFLSRHQKRKISSDEERKIWDLLEAQKFSLFMYTSCGWFFDDISGIEPVQVMKFASRALEYVQPYHEVDLEAALLAALAGAKSNLPVFGNGKDIYLNQVKTKRMIVHGV